MFEWSKENGGNIAQYPYKEFACQLFSVTPVCPAVNDGVYSFRRVSDGKVTGSRHIQKHDGGKYLLTEENGKTGIYSIKCNRDGSYKLISTDGRESDYIFEPVSTYYYSAPAAVRICGDVNADGTVDENDAEMLQRYLVKLGDLTDASQGDVNMDGTIILSDFVALKRTLLG